MFYFDEINGCKVLKSDMIQGAEVFFTTKPKSPFDGTFSERIIMPEQVHGENIEIVDSRTEYPKTDGLILSEPNTIICLKFADCTPVVLYDYEHNVAAISHAGWRGTVARIAVKTVAKMVLNYSTKPEKLIAIIGPAISDCCYEVSEEVRNALLNTIKDKTSTYNERKVNLKTINARQLSEIGVKNIDICPYCTSCHNDLFYSYRKEYGTKERHYAVVKLENKEQVSTNNE